MKLRCPIFESTLMATSLQFLSSNSSESLLSIPNSVHATGSLFRGYLRWNHPPPRVACVHVIDREILGLLVVSSGVESAIATDLTSLGEWLEVEGKLWQSFEGLSQESPAPAAFFVMTDIHLARDYEKEILEQRFHSSRLRLHAASTLVSRYILIH